MSNRGRAGGLAMAMCGLLACKPSVGQPPYLITEPTLLAVQGDPPEVRPNASVTYSFLVASPAGTVTGADAFWDVCETPKPPAESNAVASACAQPPDAGAAATGQTFVAAMPAKACQLFGPIAPPPVAGQPAVRPRDPDSSGGYYLPVHLWLPNLQTGPASGFALERISCNLANAPATAIADFNSKYVANLAPGIDHTDVVTSSGERLPLDGPDVVTVHAGTSVIFEAALTADSAETFAYYDAAAQAVVEQHESLHLAWFITAGTFEHDRTGVAAGEAAMSTSNRWTAPPEPDGPSGLVNLWLVLRDSRGGIATKSYTLQTL